MRPRFAPRPLIKEPAPIATTTYDPVSGLPTSPGALGRAGVGVGGALSNPDTFEHPFGGVPGWLNPNGSPALPGTINAGGFMPDFRNLINTDPAFLMAQQALSAAGIQSAAQRDAAFQRAYASAGMPIDLSGAAAALGMSPGDLQTIIDPTTQQLAQQNTQAGLSTEARLQQAHLDAVRNIKNLLNSRGLLGSGETGYQLGREQQNFAQGEYDARAKLLDYLSSYQQGYVQSQQQAAAQLAQAASEAATRQASLDQNKPQPGTPAKLIGVDRLGRPIYEDPNGTRWTFKDPKDPNSGTIPWVDPGPAPAPAPTTTPAPSNTQGTQIGSGFAPLQKGLTTVGGPGGTIGRLGF